MKICKSISYHFLPNHFFALVHLEIGNRLKGANEQGPACFASTPMWNQ